MTHPTPPPARPARGTPLPWAWDVGAVSPLILEGKVVKGFIERMVHRIHVRELGRKQKKGAKNV